MRERLRGPPGRVSLGFPLHVMCVTCIEGPSGECPEKTARASSIGLLLGSGSTLLRVPSMKTQSGHFFQIQMTYIFGLFHLEELVRVLFFALSYVLHLPFSFSHHHTSGLSSFSIFLPYYVL